MDPTDVPPALDPPPPVPSDSLDFESLYSEITRMRPRTSQSPRPVSPRSPYTKPRNPFSIILPELKVDLRTLDYISDCESQLMCPICHLPFVDPIALECDHYFCRSCFNEFWEGVANTERPKCPTCRAQIGDKQQRVSRLIVNMCDDLRVRCPHKHCKQIIARGYVEHHAAKECGEELLDCATFPDCQQKTRRKHFVQGQCRHRTHIECECGEEVEHEDWVRHKKELCPNAGKK